MSKYYINPEELKFELVEYKKTCDFAEDDKGKMKIKKRKQISRKLGQMIQEIAEGLSSKGNWSGYTWKEDMVSEAKLMVFLYMHNYKEEYKNPFNYISKLCENAFIQFVQKNNKHSSTKQKLYDNKDILFDLEENNVDSINYELFADKKQGLF